MVWYPQSEVMSVMSMVVPEYLDIFAYLQHHQDQQA